MKEADQGSETFLSESSSSASRPLFDTTAELGEPLKLNVYDVTPMNGYVNWVGIGVYHSGIEAYGVEYAYGAHDYSSSGLVQVEPQKFPGFKFRKSIILGTLLMGPERFSEVVKKIGFEYSGDSYHLLFRNCNHFSDDVSSRLVGSSIPSWVNRLARLGSFCSCCLPGDVQTDHMHAHRSEAYMKVAKPPPSTYLLLVSNLAMMRPGKFHFTSPTGFLPTKSLPYSYELALLQDSKHFR